MPPTTTSPPLPHTTTKPHHHNTSSTLKNHTTKILKTTQPQPLQNQTNIPQNPTFHHTLPQIKKHTKINTLKNKKSLSLHFPYTQKIQLTQTTHIPLTQTTIKSKPLSHHTHKLIYLKIKNLLKSF